MTPRGRGRYGVLLRLAGAAILWENLWPRLWPATATVAVFLIVALSDVLPDLPAWLHIVILAGFAGLLGFTLWRALRGLALPGRLAARHRIERDSGLEDRPLAALDDDLVAGAGDRVAEGLWQHHRARMAAQVRKLHVRAPAAGLARLDPWGFRAALAILLLIALVGAGGDAGGRIAAALVPDVSGGPPVPVTAEVWITPPAYTRVAPIFLDRKTAPPAKSIAVPKGSTVLAQVSGTRKTPELRFGDHKKPFKPLGPDASSGSFRLETTIQGGKGLAVVADGRTLAEWPIHVTADAPPTVALTEPPSGTDAGLLKLAVEATDDYGVKALTATLRRVDGPSDEKPLVLSIPLPGAAPKVVKMQTVRDLTASLWAGLPVTMVLTAEDVAGQKVSTAPVDFTLPERTFNHPVARAIVAERKKLVDPGDLARAEVAAGLGAIAAAPQAFRGDVVVSLALGVARGRLIHDTRDSAISSVAELLWDTALRLEDGGLTLAERQLQRAQQRLDEALQRGAQSPEVEKLMRELEQAMADFLNEMTKRLQDMGAVDMPMDPNAQTLDTSDLQQMMDEIQRLAQSGAMDAARQKLAELKQMLDSLRQAMRGNPQQQRAQQRRSAEAQRLLDELRQLAARQQDLLDNSFARQRREQNSGAQMQPGQQRPGQRGQQGQRGRQGQEMSAADDAKLQEALRRALGEMMLEVDRLAGKIPEKLGEAERAMRRAAKALQGEQTQAAIDAQTQALEALRSGSQDARQQMAQQMQMGAGMRRGGVFVGRRPVMPFGRQTDRDPFGRRRSEGATGFSSDNSVKVPSNRELRRAYDIQRELRRRAGQRTRPQFELDYIERLLRQF